MQRNNAATVPGPPQHRPDVRYVFREQQSLLDSIALPRWAFVCIIKDQKEVWREVGSWDHSRGAGGDRNHAQRLDYSQGYQALEYCKTRRGCQNWRSGMGSILAWCVERNLLRNSPVHVSRTSGGRALQVKCRYMGCGDNDIRASYRQASFQGSENRIAE